MANRWILVALSLLGCDAAEKASEKARAIQMESMESAGKDMLDRAKEQVATDAIAQYRIVRDHGTAIDRCVQAGMVSAALLQANKEADYARWKTIEAADCEAAGMPK